MKILVLGLGNDLIADDAVGILAARRLKPALLGQADVIESSLSGLALLDLFIGYDRAIVIDAIHTADGEPGAILELDSSDLRSVIAPSPHFAGLPEMFVLAGRLDLKFPKKVLILAVETLDPYTIGKGLSAPVEQAIPEIVKRVCRQTRLWRGSFSHA
jgi:hydrogenase maturation protease